MHLIMLLLENGNKKKVIKIENITLGQIAIALAFIVGLITSVVAILKYAKSINNKILEPINQKLDY